VNPPDQRDWDKELAEIDKLIAAGAGQRQAGTDAPAHGRPAPPAAVARAVSATDRRAALFTWLRLLLALSVGVAMTQWPYTHGCGLALYGYLAGVGVVLAAAFWTMVASWRTRSGFAHFLSIGLLFWGALLGAREVLPRVGYAKQSAAWSCGASAAATPPAPSVAPTTTPAGSDTSSTTTGTAPGSPLTDTGVAAPPSRIPQPSDTLRL
jgi:hypothetical protein